MALPSDLEYPRRVVVDDTDSRINYDSGSWTIDNNSFDSITRLGAPYNGTQHGTASTTASFSFQFEGDFVQVRGGKDNRKISRPDGVVNDNTTLLAKWTCSIDGSPITSGSYYVYMFDTTHNMLCEQSHLSHSPHTLTVNVTIDDPNTQMFWLDKIEYSPLPGANLAQEVLKFDASDSSIQYDNSTGAWLPIDNLFNATGTTGASANVNFNGTSISFYGFNEGDLKSWLPSTGKYFIDNKGDTTFDLPGSKPIPGFPNNKTDWYNQLWFTASNLAPGSHEMTLTFTGVFKGDSIQWLSVDYFYVTASEGSKLNTGNPVGGGGGGSNGNNGSSSKTNVGAIAGGVVGGVVLLVAIGLVLFFLLRRRKSKNNYAGQYDGFQPQNMYSTPGPINSGFGPAGGPRLSQQYAPLQQTTPSVYSVPMSVVPSTVTANTVTPMASNYDPYRSSTYAGSNSDGSRTALTHSSMVVANPSPNNNSNQNWVDMKDAQRAAVDTRPVERQHQDSGIRYSQPGVVDIPPTYTAT